MAAQGDQEDIINKELENRGIKKEKDVLELYLASRGLTDLQDLSRFKYLKCLWLNNNRFRRVQSIISSRGLVELHLENNHLVDIAGALHKLTCLETLMLHNNQLTKLKVVINELRKMQNLKTLSLFDNPLAQEENYRINVLSKLPSVELLDRHVVTLNEQIKAKAWCEDNVVDTKTAFGRHTDFVTSTGLISQRPIKTKDAVANDSRKPVADNFYGNMRPFTDLDTAAIRRRELNSVTVYTSFDWSNVPKGVERRMAEAPFENPQLVTRVYR